MTARPPSLAALLEEASRLASGVAARVLADPRGQEAVAHAVGMAQRNLRRIEALQAGLMKAAGVPGRRDYDELARTLARVKRKARELDEKVAALRGAGAASSAGEGTPSAGAAPAPVPLADGGE